MNVAPNTAMLNVAQIVSCTEAEGPGRRFALWVQGCPLRCVGCCNPEFLPTDGGELISVEALGEQLRKAEALHELEGITLIGGEPFAQSAGCAALAVAAHELGLTVMLFSGFTLEELRGRGDQDVNALLSETDILVDGPYDQTQPETQRRWIGSGNQQVHFLSDRCDPADWRWNEPNTLELRVAEGQLTVNGFPAPLAKLLWKRPRLK